MSSYSAAQKAARCAWLADITQSRFALLNALVEHKRKAGNLDIARWEHRAERAHVWSTTWERLRYHYRQVERARLEGWELDGPRPLFPWMRENDQ